MGLLFIFLSVILMIILIARIASKTRPDSEKTTSKNNTGMYTVKKIEGSNLDQEQMQLFEALISVLIQKGVITEEEMTSEMKAISMKKESGNRGYQSGQTDN